MELLIATTNKGKIQEYKHLLERYQFTLRLPSDFHIVDSPSEDGKTLEENAVIKARFYFERSGIPVLADDTGFEIDALGGEPGVYARRWPGYEADDQELLAFALERLKDVPEGDRSARFRAVIAIQTNQDNLHCFDGSMEGSVVSTPVYPIMEGYPFRSIFYYPPIQKVLAELPIEEIPDSHRKEALSKADSLLRQLALQ